MYLKKSKTIVIKIGSSIIIDKNKKIRKKWLTEFAKDIKDLLKQKKNVILVSSGAIALGCKKLNLSKQNIKIDKSQAVASIGQIELMNLFSETFTKFKLNISQILLTLEDTEERRRSLNAKRTFENLFDLDFIPVVNENDTIATTEIKYGDNDRLASRVAQITNADTLILLSDVDGLYTKNPKIYKNAKLIRKINNIKKDLKEIYIKGVNEYGSGGMQTKIEAAKICQLSGCSMIIANGLYLNPISRIIEKNNKKKDLKEIYIKGVNEYGSGGMQTKIEAAKICQLSGCSMIIANGLYLNPISRIIEKKNFTMFKPKVSKLDARKKWIISSVAPKGAIIIDDGAKQALKSGKSLLAAGIKKVSGKFKKGDHIKVLDKKNSECARGLSSFTSDEVIKIMGHHSNEIEKLLGYVSKSEVIHKDDMVEI